MTKNLRYTDIKEEIPVNFTVPIEQVTKEGEKTLLRGLASKVTTSTSGHRTTESAIAEMKEQAVDLPGFMNHDPDQVYGKIVAVENTSVEEFTPIFELNTLSGYESVDAPVLKIKHWLDNGIKLGMSIGGMIRKARFVEDMDSGEWWIEVLSILLVEVSVTPIPAVRETIGETKIQNTVKCESGLCQILTQTVAKAVEYTPNLRENGNDRLITPNIVTNTAVSQDVTDKEELEEVPMKQEGKQVTEQTAVLDSIKQMNESVSFLMQREKARIEQEEADRLKQEQEAQMNEMRNQMEQMATDVVQKALENAVGGLRLDKEHRQASLGGNPAPSVKVQEMGGDPVPETPEVIGSTLGQTFKDPATFPSHIGGTKYAQSYSTSELAHLV